MGKSIKLHNKGTPKRTWTNVADTVAAVMLILDKGARNEIYNISSDFEQTNLETVSKIVSCYFVGDVTFEVPDLSDYLDLSYDRPGQDVCYKLNAAKLRELGWEAKKEFDKQLPYLVEWYKERFKW